MNRERTCAKFVARHDIFSVNKPEEEGGEEGGGGGGEAEAEEEETHVPFYQRTVGLSRVALFKYSWLVGALSPINHRCEQREEDEEKKKKEKKRKRKRSTHSHLQ